MVKKCEKKPSKSSSDISVHTIFGQTRYLEGVAAKLAQRKVLYGRDIERMTQEEFYSKLGRVSGGNKRRIDERLRDISISFRP